MEMITVAAVNELARGSFVERFGDVAEHSPWVAGKAFDFGPFSSVAEIVSAFSKAVNGAYVDRQLELICAHPDLAGKAAVAGELAKDSAAEQAQAGIGGLTKEEFKKFTDYNNQYKDRFGFPFILAVKGATKDQILASFEERIDNEPTREFRRAIEEICRIIRFRLEARVQP
jgi:2-oxo-4-hydroxy-4-carboxy-5-ureidoimidazoline decarboxylase